MRCWFGWDEGSTTSRDPCRIGKVFERLSWSMLEGSRVSFCNLARKASMPSGSASSFGGGGGGGGDMVAYCPAPGFGRDSSPFENADPRDAVEVVDSL